MINAFKIDWKKKMKHPFVKERSVPWGRLRFHRTSLLFCETRLRNCPPKESFEL